MNKTQIVVTTLTVAFIAICKLSMLLAISLYWFYCSIEIAVSHMDLQPTEPKPFVQVAPVIPAPEWTPTGPWGK